MQPGSKATDTEQLLAGLDSLGGPAPAAAKGPARSTGPMTFRDRLDEIDALMESGGWAAAEQKAGAVAEKHPGSAGLWQRLGRCRLKLRRYAQAQEALEKAIEIDPKSTPANLDLASLLIEMNRFEAALGAVEKLEEALGRRVAAATPIRRAAEQGLKSGGHESQLAHLVYDFERALASDDRKKAAAAQRKIQGQRDALREMGWNQDPMLARAAYLAFNPISEATAQGYEPGWFDAAVEFDFINWPRRVHNWVEGRDVADVGCGHGAYSIGFVVAGARTYTGIDPVIDLDSVKARNKRTRKNQPFPCTPRQIAARYDQVEIRPGKFESFNGVKTFDTIVMHNVSEHLMQIEEVFEGLKLIMNDNTRLIFHHHNFYCWNGHHLPPSNVKQLDESNPEQAKYYDWRHVRFQPDRDHYIARALNRIRLDDLRALCDRNFDVEIWDERNSSADILARLTPQILADLPEYTERELSVNGVFVVAKLKP